MPMRRDHRLVLAACVLLLAQRAGAQQPSPPEAKAIKALQALGGQVYELPAEDPTPGNLPRVEVGLGGLSLVEALPHLKALRALRRLTLTRLNDMPAAEVKALAELQQLESLEIIYTRRS